MDPLRWAAAGLLLMLLSLLGTALAMAYARRRRLLDEPGGRRLHVQPTVRGAGAAAMGLLLLASQLLLITAGWPLPLTLAMTGGLLLLVLVGYADDHQALAARWRLAAQLVAAAALVWALVPGQWAVAGLALLGTVWLVNLYNFIDGSDLFAASHGVLLGLGLMLAGIGGGDPLLAALALALAAVLLGFVPFNWPPARAFMGDVASGPIGYFAALLLLLGWREGSVDPLWPLVLLSALITDATLTLLWRMRSGQRWTEAHRSHLYQWLRRRGHSALVVCVLYLGWALLASTLFVLWPLQWGGRPVAFLLVYALATLLWWRSRHTLILQASRSLAA